MEIRYTIPFSQYFRLVLAVLTRRNLSFRKLSADCVIHLSPALDVQGLENLPAHGGYVILANHYYNPKFRAWWIAFAISAVVPREMHWVIASAWTYPSKPYGRLFENLSRWVFRKLAGVYNFTNMPPMPPRAFEVAERARTVRKVMRIVRDDPGIILGLVPEGSDNLDGKMHLPPPGAGRFIAHLQASGLHLVPAGIYETDRLCLRIGPPFSLDLSSRASPDKLDESLRKQVYRSIAALLPNELILDYLDK